MGIPRFFGRNTELQLIKDLWKKACEGEPQVVSLVADTGVGKTRLVQAFYEWLSTDPEQGDGIGSQGYWPDDIGSGRQRLVNPSLERFASFDLKNDQIPWLWWGMYWTDADGENECGVVRFHDFFDVHISMLELQHHAHRKTLSTVSDAVKSEAINFFAGLIPGGSQVLSVIDLSKKLYISRKEQQEAQKGLASQDKSRQETLADNILQRLHENFSHKQKGTRQIPMVLFLDDIHFATDISRDGFSLQFLDRLLRQAAREQWPLLIIATHWRAPWQAHQTGVRLENGKPWRRIILEMNEEQSTHMIGVHTLILDNIPCSDLRSVIIDMMPGLNWEDQNKLLSRVDNVRWLVEVLNALNDSTENFECNDRSQPLSAHGHRRLEGLLKSRGYLEVIRQRLEGDAMCDVRAVLGATAWHAHELEFFSPLASAFGPELVKLGALPHGKNEPSPQVLDVLMKALDPAALLEGQGQNNRLPSLVRFPERGYLEVAKELFNSEHLPDIRKALGNEIVIWMQADSDGSPRWKKFADVESQKAFLEIAVAVLRRLQPQINEDQQRELEATEKSLLRRLEKGRISEQELEQELHELKQELLNEVSEPQVAEAAKYYAIAMAELIHLLRDKGSKRAFILAYEMAENHQLKIVFESLRFSTVICLLELWQAKTACWTQAKMCLDFVINRQEALLEVEESSEYLANKGVALKTLAELEREMGDTDKARESYQCSMGIANRLLEEFGETPERLSNLAILLRYLAFLDENDGNLDQARTGFQQSSAIYKRLLEEYGETPGRLRDYTSSLTHLARLDRSRDKDEARTGYLQSLEIWKRLIKEFGKTPERLRGLTIPLIFLADLDEDNGDTDLARAGYQESLAIHKSLLEEFGETPQRLSDLATSLVFLANFDKEMGNTSRARTGYKRSLDNWKRLIDEFGESPDRLGCLSHTIKCLVDLDEAQCDKDIALEMYRYIQTSQELLLENYGETQNRLIELTETMECLIGLNQSQDNIDQARVIYRRILTNQNRLMDDSSETSFRLRNEAFYWNRLAELDETSGDWELARTNYQKAIDIQKRLLGDFGNSLEKHLLSSIFQELATTQHSLANLDQTRGDTDLAKAGYQRALKIWEECDLLDSGFSSFNQEQIIIIVEKLADLNRESGEIDQARAFYRQSLTIWIRLLEESSWGPVQMHDVTIPLERLADLDEACGDTFQARMGFQQSLAIWKELLENYGETPERLNGLNFAKKRLANLNLTIGDQ